MTILVPVDFSPYSRAAIERALVLAGAAGAQIRLLHVLALPTIALESNWLGSFWKELRASEEAKAEALRKDYEGRGSSISVELGEGDPARVIQGFARAPDVELVVMGSHGLRGFDRAMIGSVADRTLRGSPKPVLVVREDESNAFRAPRSILFATDFSESAEHVESSVLEWAKRLQVEVEVFHVVPDTTVLFVPYAVPESRLFDEELMEAATRRLAGVTERLRSRGVEAKSEVGIGYASREIIQRAESTGAQIIALGNRGHGCLRRYAFGSVVQSVVADASCSVLVGCEGPDRFDSRSA